MELTRRKLKIDKITYSNRGLEQRMMLVKINLWCIPNIIVFSRVTFNQQFCRWRCFSFCWFAKREFGKLTNGFPVIEGPARPPRPPPCITTSSLLICSWHDMTLTHFVQ